MGAAVLLKQFESILGGPLGWQSRPEPERAPTGVAEVDSATGGLPRGCLTEIVGPASSGRTSLLLSVLAAATARQEACALVDAEDAFSPALRRRCRRATGAPALGALRAQRRTRPQSGRSADPGRRFRTGDHGSGRYAAADRAPHLADFLVPPAPRRGTYTDRAGLAGAAIQRQDLRLAGDRVRPQRDNLVRRAFRLPPAARLRGARPIHSSEEAMFACLHGHGQSDRARLRILTHGGSHGAPGPIP